MTQRELYSVADSMIASLEQPAKLAKFVLKKPTKYVPAHIVALKTLKTNAFNLPDSSQVSSVHETNAIDLLGLAEKCEDNFQDLKTYIHDGWAKQYWKTKYDEAGMEDYAKASHDNWEFVVSMNKKMNDFIGAHPGELATGHMIVGFDLLVQADSDAFDSKYTEFKNTRETASITSAKISANNTLYAALQDLQNDAHSAFRRDPDGLREFMITVVKSIVSPPGSANLGIECIEVGSNLPVTKFKATIQSATGIAMVLASGDLNTVDFNSIDPDDYRVKIEFEGEVPRPAINMVKEVNTGVSARLKVMVPEV